MSGIVGQQMLRLIAFCAVLLAVVAAVGFGLLALSPSYNSCIQKNGQHATEQFTNSGQQIVERPVDNPTRARLFLYCGSYFANRNGAAFTGLFTIALSIATFLLGYLAWDQGRTNRAQLRAYVSAVPMKAAFSSPETISVVLTVTNTGQTPAFDTQCLWGIDVLPMPTQEPSQLPQLRPDAKAPLPNSVVFSNSAFSSTIPRRITETELGRIHEGTHAIFVFGKVTYVDVFREKQWVEFCSYMHRSDYQTWRENVRSQSPRTPVQALFQPTEWNNDASFR